jgi:hypothetical protein
MESTYKRLLGGTIMESTYKAEVLISEARSIRSALLAAGADVARIDYAIAHAAGDVEHTRRKRIGYAA